MFRALFEERRDAAAFVRRECPAEIGANLDPDSARVDRVLRECFANASGKLERNKPEVEMELGLELGSESGLDMASGDGGGNPGPELEISSLVEEGTVLRRFNLKLEAAVEMSVVVA